ncbi:MAG TPA: H-NS family nucleoid-associated regulatory protein, partial [Anaerovoracaceae bacterium]|nr:H-NS family nucleoid-associated regulatory protein [Anaerovoracaceae bacterium]
MATYKELAEQKAKIEAEMNALLENEKAQAVAEIREKVETYGITPDDIFGKPKKPKAPAVV